MKHKPIATTNNLIISYKFYDKVMKEGGNLN